MLELIASIIGLCGSIAFYFYKKRARLQVKSETKAHGIDLILTNKSDFAIDIEYIRLIHRRSYLKGYFYNENSLFHLVESEEHGFMSTQDDKLNLKILHEDPILKLSIPFNLVENLYHDFLPYDYSDPHQIGMLRLPVKMPDCYIGIYFKNGKTLKQKIHEPFYSYYRKSMGCFYDDDIAILKGHRKTKFCFNSIDNYKKFKNKLLDHYATSKRNEYNLKK